jgi:hypothetical protein
VSEFALHAKHTIDRPIAVAVLTLRQNLSGARSSAAKAPTLQRSSEPVSFRPNCGLTIRREKKSCSGVENIDAFSMKNGRRSGKVTS